MIDFAIDFLCDVTDFIVDNVIFCAFKKHSEKNAEKTERKHDSEVNYREHMKSGEVHYDKNRTD